jgi:ribosomal protein L32
MTSLANGSAKRAPRSRAKAATISTFIECTKVGATKRINHARRECGLPWQPRFFDRALRTVKPSPLGRDQLLLLVAGGCPQ